MEHTPICDSIEMRSPEWHIDDGVISFEQFCTEYAIADRERFHAWTVGSEHLDTTNFDADDWRWWHEAFIEWGDFADERQTRADAIR